MAIAAAVVFFGAIAAWQLVAGEAAKPVRPVAVPGIYFSPSSITANVGDIVTVEVRENSGTSTVNAVQANILYPASILEYVSVDAATSPFNIQAQSTQTSGEILMARGVGGGATLTGDQHVTKVSFKVLQATTATLTYKTDTAVVSSDTNTNVLVDSNSKGTATIKPPRGNRK